MDNARQVASEAAAQIADRLGGGFAATVVLGTGWDDAFAELGELEAQIPTTELAGFPATRVEGHGGTVGAVAAGDRRLLVYRGRVHLYEGNSAAAVSHGVRAAAAAGCEAAVLTNAAGGLRPHYRVGAAVLISDHLNLTGASPVEGTEWGTDRFVNLVDSYSPRLRALAAEVAPGTPEGVYAGLRGPHFETPAEIQMLRSMGADLVGMSTVLEAIAARHCGMETLGVSLVTNLAAGMSDEGPSHQEVLDAGAASGTAVGRLLRGVIDRL
ncbi:MAG: purine-nucleoside phosphorylase [bacterium]|nr:purine-nucleoside phosphorylase [bacterium]MYB25711.1 purine-nucleoside phosphorylase [Acidimicrobiia bacterium]